MTRYSPGQDRAGSPVIWRTATTEFGADVSYEISMYGAREMVRTWRTDPAKMAEQGFTAAAIAELEKAIEKVKNDNQGL